VTNVIDNARKWSPADGTVFVEVTDGVLSVRDQGPGFRKEDLPHVFVRFYRADAARRMPGSGLGLAIVKQAADAYGGSVTAANAPDGGAVVTLRFGSVPER
jgi:two-component system sensor histidine kinase MprB